ncbi:MAG: hypothetical protein QGG63_01775 [Candidatus Pacebacteria bacterium]|jgi:hypothetical protein|nr:hypothetical protein [Candidatus Paceibacterota bacterium]|tara:strand:- start:1072 stop:1440 length:369 start_codon:yes stop_codon:yes gene_type:complete
MEEENPQKNNFQDQSQNIGQTDLHKKYPILLFVILAVVLAGATFFLYIFSKSSDLVEPEAKETFSKEEKLVILEGLAGDPENIPSIQERKGILNNLIESRADDLRDYSEEEKLQILQSLEQQ